MSFSVAQKSSNWNISISPKLDVFHYKLLCSTTQLLNHSNFNLSSKYEN